MILTKQQIRKIEHAWYQAQKAENIAREKMAELETVIVETLKIKGSADYLMGDGFGFTPESNDDTHIYLADLIEFAKNGEDITEDFILDNLTF
jgi:hypothetical protein